jgi:hypothetical protein
MNLKNALLIGVMLVCLKAVVFAGGVPEFDSVGDDTSNYFENSIIERVTAENYWNQASDFITTSFLGTVMENDSGISVKGMEYFNPPVQITEDTCFPEYVSAYTQWRRPAEYEWQIVLQMDPQSDIDIHITECILKQGSQTAFGLKPWEGSDQTGRYQLTNGTSFFITGANPSITVEAKPGPNAVFGFNTPFFLTSRASGGLIASPLKGLNYSAIAIWETNLVARMPEFLVNAPDHGLEYPLSAGDTLNIKIHIPFNNCVDVRYGEDNVTIRYIGTNNTIFTNESR